MSYVINKKKAAEGGIVLKGTGYGLRMIFPEDPPEEEIFSSLGKLSDEVPVMAGNIGIVLDFQGRHLSRRFILRLLSEFVWPGNMRVLSWICLDGETMNDLRSMGAATGEPVPEKTGGGERSTHCSLILHRSLRSGQRVEHDGDVLIIGHVNDGAEVFASGSIYVWGRLKGIAHAGLDGEEEHTVVAGLFEATQVRLGSKVSASLGSDMEWWGKPVIITCENDSLVVRELQL